MFYSELIHLPPILDFEASSLSDTSYPISAGLLMEGRIHFWLIRPREEWIDWSLASQAIHGIKRSTLIDDGTDAELVAQQLKNLLSEASEVYSDNPYWENKWLNCLGQFTQELRDVRDLVPSLDMKTLNQTRSDVFKSSKLTPHRADHDALVLGMALNRITELKRL